jgi:prepilin-type N-terminal cleavage/methylation domain-containing protein
MRRERPGVSLPEVLIAITVMAVLFLPIMFTFLTTAGGAGQDVREVRATMMAQEILEQVIGVHRKLSEFSAIPLDNSPDPGREQEIDLDLLAKRCPGEQGFSLWLGKNVAQCSRMILSAPRSGFTRSLSIVCEATGKNRGSFLMTPALFRVTAHVRFTTPQTTGEIAKDVRLSTFLATDAVHLEEDWE